MSLGERALLIAGKEYKKGVKEDGGLWKGKIIPAGKNWGNIVSLYLQAAKIKSPSPWCASFVTYCLLNAGMSNEVLKEVGIPGSTFYWMKWADKKGLLSTEFERGDAFCYNDGWPKSRSNNGHIGWVCEVRKINGNTYVRTIEGNWKNSVFRRGSQGQKGVIGWLKITPKYRAIKFSKLP